MALFFCFSYGSFVLFFFFFQRDPKDLNTVPIRIRIKHSALIPRSLLQREKSIVRGETKKKTLLITLLIAKITNDLLNILETSFVVRLTKKNNCKLLYSLSFFSHWHVHSLTFVLLFSNFSYEFSIFLYANKIIIITN